MSKVRITSYNVCYTKLLRCSLGVEDVAFNDAVKIYPNPNNGVFYIKNELNINLKRAEIFDMSGRLISA